MSVLRIEEALQDNRSVEIRVDGVLDRKSLQILAKVCHSHFSDHRRIILNLKGLTYITREGRNYLAEIKHKVTFVNTPLFMKL